MTVLRRCRKCGIFKVLTEENFDRSTRPHCMWIGSCRACLAESDSREGAEAPPRESPEAREHRLGRERDRGLVPLIRRYEAVRGTPGRDRQAAYNALALALRRHGRRVDDGVRYWAWDEALGDIATNLVWREWRTPVTDAVEMST